ncbi:MULTISPECIES: DUF4377 domain-containing protein [Providencia]|uniref:Type IV secretion system putative lipoprotein virB7 n=2 Tax=Providencia alcalifaciens TaxID=126385 RepID=A0AAW9V631_9GAMM|nr:MULTISPECIES: DUF4377 domain-containing protein [Providencia]ETT05026.1 PF14302 domain protein [Providencia alcalifaciens F90-2004]EUC94452.1 PF14302 domain protein [Providencia alcalifaciens PAL-2]EUD09552.1 PF14302 domain protein [Providencia alcalifaciens 205/92]MTB33711.1 DUF4377 domain-containing protein [Providencia alcalifaciens]MTC16994.1 DUF4377 domain-containing protein [Providencia alcalifaciens]
MKKILLASSFLVLLAGCQNGTNANTMKPANNNKVFYIDSSLADCVGVAPMKCMKVKEKPTDEWQYFYSSIQGFNYEPGYHYVVEVQQFDIPNPPADASSIRYELVKIIEKK